MKPRDVVTSQIHHKATRPVPYTLGFEGDVAERLDAHYGGAEWRGELVNYIAFVPGVANLEFEATGEGTVVDKYGTAWRVDRRPWRLEKPAMPESSFAHYDFPAPEHFLSEESKKHALELCAQNADSFLLAGMGWGLFETSWGLRGFENALMDAAAEPAFYGELLDRITENFLAFVDFVCDLPVDGIMFGDDWGDQRGVIIGPERWRTFMKPRWARIYEAVHARGKLVVTHCCGSIREIMPDVIEIGLDVLESCQPEAEGMNPYELKREFGSDLTFWGCLGSQSTIPFGTPERIGAEVRKLCAEMGEGGGFIIAPAKALQPETPTENAAAVFEAFARQD